MSQLLNLGHLETTKPNFKKFGWSRPEKHKLEKGWFGSNQSNSTLWVGHKQGVSEPFGLSLGHFSEFSKLSYLIWKRGDWAICWLKNIDNCTTNIYFTSIFRHIFELWLTHAIDLNILGCHTATSYSTEDYDTSNERGEAGLSYEPKILKLLLVK